MTLTTVGYDTNPKVGSRNRKHLVISYSLLPDFYGTALWWPLCSCWRVHHHPSHPHRGEQLCRVLQEQAVEERGGSEEKGEGAGREEQHQERD